MSEEKIAASDIDRVEQSFRKFLYWGGIPSHLENKVRGAHSAGWWDGQQEMLQRLAAMEAERDNLQARVAELEAAREPQEIKSDALCDIYYTRGLQAGFQMGDAGDNAGLEAAIESRSGAVRALHDANRAELEAQPVRVPEWQYYYRTSRCPAIGPKSPDCVCWHNEGEGPFPEARHDTAHPPIKNWRKSPTPPAQQPAGEPVAWFTEDHLTDKSATTYDPEIAKRWAAKGWPVDPLYTHPTQPPADADVNQGDDTDA